MTSSESPTLRMGAAERRRQKIIARGKSRLEGITNLTLNDPVEPLEEHSGSKSRLSCAFSIGHDMH